MRKIKLHLNDNQWRELYHSLNDLKTALTERGFHTHDVDDLLYKVLNAKSKRIKVVA